ncbi:neuropeptide SIFamide receptor-like [Dreissena polymorpha]|uniref:G-protein coupled receptors family 1 profile domain-containing protein n=1 Tax=Dreissena polymorpha TaxID=45954 RepID=A0A9D4REE3_DREPO|nr:neuropeptide SIFamide receptor-like [Dreissena polymorpha]KAH3863295.1 hypothetical protein DPMN_026276 [Dreissena polymorpha]
MENTTLLYEYNRDALVVGLHNDTNGNYNYVNDNMTQMEYELLKQPPYMILVYALTYGLVFVFGLLGNTFVVAVIYREPSMRNVTNYFILNMAVADLMVVLLCVPITFLLSIFTGWRYGQFMCKVTPYVNSVAQCASVNTLAAIAIDRYLAICYSRRSKISRCASRTTIASIWIYSLTVMIPVLVYYQHYYHPDHPSVPMCHQIWPSYNLQRGYFLLGLFFLCYIIPLLMILICYLLIAVKVWRRNAPGVQTNGRLIIYKSKVKVLKMLAVIVLLFAFSWLPLHAIYLRLYYGPHYFPPQEQSLINEIILPIAQWLGTSNCGINPIIYCFFSKKYRREFRKLIYCRAIRLHFQRNRRPAQSLVTRYVNVDSISVNNDQHHHNAVNQMENRVSSNKYMVVAFNNGKMTVSFRKEHGSDDSSF